nr:MAG TPA: hypothetical protein [Caudoviricetes sp.]
MIYKGVVRYMLPPYATFGWRCFMRDDSHSVL